MMELLLILVSAALSTGILAYCVVDLFLSQSSYEERVKEAISKQLSSINTVVSPEQMLQMVLIIFFSLFILGFLLGGKNLAGGVLLGIVMGTCGAYVPNIVVGYLIRKRLERINEELPGALEIISSSLRAGLTLNQAILRNLDRFPETIGQEFSIIMYECRLGRSLTDALNNWAKRCGLMDVKLTAAASELSLRHGGNLADSYRGLSKTIRDRFMFQREVQTLTTEGRMQAIVMSLLPFAILIVMTLIRRQHMLEFLASPLGIGSVILVFVMQLAAYLWIKKAMSIEM